MNITSFPILIRQNFVAIRVYIENAINQIYLYYKSKNKKDWEKIVTFPNNNIYTFYLDNIEPDTKYYYHIKSIHIHGKFKTLPNLRNKKDVNFNVLSCFGYGFDPENYKEFAILPKNGSDFNLLLGDNIYADYFYRSPESKIIAFKPSINLEEYNQVYRQLFFNVRPIKKMLHNSLNIILMDDHEIFDEWNTFYRSFEYSTNPGNNGFSELQIASNIIYSALSISDPILLAPPPPIPIISQNDEYILWSVRSPNYITSVNNGILSFQNNLNPNLKYFKFSYGKYIDYFVLNVMTDRTPMTINDNSQIISIISNEQMNWLLHELNDSNAKIKFIVTTQTFSDLIIIPKTPITPISEKVTISELYNRLVFDPNYYAPLVSLQGAIPTSVTDYENLTLDQKFRVFGPLVSQLGGSAWMYYDKSNNIVNIPQPNKQRNQIIDFIRHNKIHGVIFLTGDFHSSYVGYIDDLNTPNVFPIIEICSSPVGSPPTTTIIDYINDNPDQKQFIYATDQKNFVNISTTIDKNKIIVTYYKKNNEQDRIKINLKKYKKLQKGDLLSNPIKIHRK